MRGLTLRRGRTLGWVTLLLLTFAGGVVAGRLWRGDAGEDPARLALVTSVPQVPTPLPTHTPTPTAPDADAMGVGLDPERAAAEGELPTLYLDIAPDDFAVIEAKREEALKTWILQSTNADFVPATVRVGDGPAVPVRLRLKGDWGDHFTRDKWSYRIEVRGSAAVMGMRVFSLQDPSTRSYVNEWAFLETLRREGVLAVGYGFAHVVQNGRPLGVYAVEEGFSKELLESQGRRESVIIRYNEDLLWEYWAAYTNDEVTPPGVGRFHIIDEFGSGAVSADPVMAARRDAAVGRLRAWEQGMLPASDVFDVATLARYWALVDLWDARHAVYWNNLRYYYNPVTAKLEPIGFDAQPLFEGTPLVAEQLPGMNALVEMGDPRLQRAYAEALWAYTEPAYLASLEASLSRDLATFYAALEPEFGAAQWPDGRSVLGAPWDLLEARRVALREMLSPVQATYAYRPLETPTNTLVLEVGNLLALPVEIVGIEVGDTWIGAEAFRSGTQAGLVAGADAGDSLVLRALEPDAATMPYVTLTADVGVPEAAIDAADTRIVSRIWGLTTPITRPVLPSYPPPTAGALPPAPALEEALARHSYLGVDADAERLLTIAAGVHTITESLVLPEDYGLRLGPGTTLRFAPEAYVLARGPLTFEGTADAPVVLQPVKDVWRGIVVLDAGAPSVWTHVTVEDTDVIELPGWTLTGAITFYQSPVQLSACRIIGTRAEDAINTIRTTFHFRGIEVAGTASDAFDADFCEGTVTQSSFHDIGGDAVDVSGTQLTVEDVRVFAIGDKGVSVGEASRATIRGLSVEGADYGIVSKDMSHAAAEDVTIAAARVAGLAAYVKKPEYGAATMEARGIRFVDVPPERISLVQTGSWIDLEGTRIWGIDVDVDALYDR